MFIVIITMEPIQDDSNPTSTTPLVSVIMATHNGSRYVIDAINSVLSQSYTNIEIIVIDDASSDDTPARVNGLHCPKIRFIKNDAKLGLTKSLNRGINLASGMYLARIDDDDIWTTSDKLERQVNYLNERLSVAIVGTQADIVNDRGEIVARLRYPTTSKKIKETILLRNPIVHSSVLIRKRALLELGLYDSNVLFGQDYELWLRLGTKYHLANLEDLAVKLHRGSKSISAQKHLRQCLSMAKCAWLYRRHYPDYYKYLPRHVLEIILNLLPWNWRCWFSVKIRQHFEYM